MTPPLSKDQIKALRDCFRMPPIQSIASRKTSITNAFVSAIIPVIPPSAEEILQAITILGMTPSTVSCAYCGDNCNAWDHLRPLVVKRRPTGYISEIANLVPCCQPCNSSKGNTPWRDWMQGKAARSPTTRGIQDVLIRIERLSAFENWREPVRVDFAKILGTEAYEDYWRELDRLVGEMEKSQAMANELRAAVAGASAGWQARPMKNGD